MGNASSGPTRKNMAAALTLITDSAGGEAPTAVIMNPGDFATLNSDFVGQEQGFIRPGQEFTINTPMRSSFPNLNVSGIPVFAEHFCPAGEIYVPNTKYTNMWASEDAMFDFSGFYSLVPLGQIGQQGVVVTGYEIASAKPSA